MSEENQSIPATSDSGDQNDHTGDDVKGSDDAAQEDHFKSAKMNQGDKRQPITAKKKKKPLSIGFLGAGMMASAIMVRKFRIKDPSRKEEANSHR